MTSPSPLLFDTYYHIYNRGNNRENIFVEERNYEYFLRLYEKHITPVADTFAYCLLQNHFHICVRIKSEEEILETRKTHNFMETLKVSTPDTRHKVQESFADPGDHEREKPLGCETYASRQFSNFFNAYAKRFASTKAMGVPAACFSIPLGVCPSPATVSFGT
jgi:REP element-mobilizing transposase RayT